MNINKKHLILLTFIFSININAYAITQFEFEKNVEAKIRIVETNNYFELADETREGKKRLEKLELDKRNINEWSNSLLKNINNWDCKITSITEKAQGGHFICASLSKNVGHIYYNVNIYTGTSVENKLDLYSGDILKIKKNELTEVMSELNRGQVVLGKSKPYERNHYQLINIVHINNPTIYVVNDNNKKIETVEILRQYRFEEQEKLKTPLSILNKKILEKIDNRPCGKNSPVVDVRVFIFPRGGAEIVKGSGMQGCDEATIEAVNKALPLLPKDSEMLDLLRYRTISIRPNDKTEEIYQGSKEIVIEDYIKNLREEFMNDRSWDAREIRHEGALIAEIEIDGNGKPNLLSIVQSSGDDFIDRNFLSNWNRIKPSKIAPKEIWREKVQLPIVYSLGTDSDKLLENSDYDAYQKMITEKILMNYRRCNHANIQSRINISLDSDGIAKIVSVRSSGVSACDEIATRAIKEAEPLPVPKNKKILERSFYINFDAVRNEL